MNSKSVNVVPGEASETDDDGEEICGKVFKIGTGPDAPPLISIDADNSPQRQLSITYGEEAFDVSAVSDEYLERWRLRRIINERCVSLLNEFIHTTAVSVSKQLVETDNLLMKSQVSNRPLSSSSSSTTRQTLRTCSK
uniref:Biogenesis of lysosome-related organelles complex 1 subunit 3 n=1 Tax=Aedes albopictus TaxID=7160 RepID=A0A1W7R4T3_AEDAL